MARIALNVDQETFDSANSGFEPLPSGEYRATVFDVKAGEVKSGDNKGKLRLDVQFKVADGETAPDGTKVGNRRVFAGINCFEGKSRKDGSPVAPFDLIGITKALGGSADDLADLDTDDWLGEELFISVAQEEKMTRESNYTESFSPKQYRNVVKGYRSVDSKEKSLAAAGAVSSGKPSFKF